MWSFSLRLPDSFVVRLSAYRRRLGARSLNEAVEEALDRAMPSLEEALEEAEAEGARLRRRVGGRGGEPV